MNSAASDRSMIIGLDLSLRAAAACAIPIDWSHELGEVRTCVSGSALAQSATPADRLKRIMAISLGIVAFCRAHRAKHVYIEEYAFAQGASHAREVAELGGVLKFRLYDQLGIVAVPVVASRARKLLLQKLPRKDVKAWVVANVKRLPGAADWTPDEVDAFVVANAGVELAGGTAMSFAGVD